MLLSLRIVLGIFVISFTLIGDIQAVSVDPTEWNQYKLDHDKSYPTATGYTESNAQYYYAYNKKQVTNHNIYEGKGKYTYTLAVNQFSDLYLKNIFALFPKTTPVTSQNNSPAPPVRPASLAYNPIEEGLRLQPANQGTGCNSGWAHATARAIEIMQATQLNNPNPQLLSAKNLIDCAGGSKGCRNQVPLQAFEYLVVYGQSIYTTDIQTGYPNDKFQSEVEMCLRPTGIVGTKITKYAIIADDNDDKMMELVSSGYPVVIEINPTSFEFMHYASGVFQPPRVSTTGSHYMTVIGYGHDPVRDLNYWLVQNSFGELWGEKGRIRIIRNAANPLAKSAILPTELV